MNYFPIVPTFYLEELASLSNHHMVLAQELRDKKYLKFYQKMVKRGDFIILDNGCCELERSLPMQTLIEAVQLLGRVNVFVLPDSNDKNNMKTITMGIKWIHSNNILPLLGKDTKFMVVPHSPQDLQDITELETQFPIDYIGINRDMDDFVGRVKILKKYQDSGKKFHFLGMRQNPIREISDLKPYKAMVLGIDSLLPYRIVRLGRKIIEHRPYPPNVNFDDKSCALLYSAKEEFRDFIRWAKE